MRREDIPEDLRALTFEFFFWFSRFEFAMKENEFLRDTAVDARAEPGWDKLVNEFKANYSTTPESDRLIALSPQRQMVGANGLEFREVGFSDHATDLERIVRLARTVRNNLFHGGKHGADYWDDVDRMRELLKVVIEVLDQLAEHAGFDADYRRYY